MTFRTIRRETCLPLLAAFVGACLAVACGRSDAAPEAPSTTPSKEPLMVTGIEKIAWDQVAEDATALARYRFIAYIDDVPQDLIGATCDTNGTNGRFPCTARLPKMLPGSHRMQIAAEEPDGQGRRRSPRSGDILLNVLTPATSP